MKSWLALKKELSEGLAEWELVSPLSLRPLSCTLASAYTPQPYTHPPCLALPQAVSSRLPPRPWPLCSAWRWHLGLCPRDAFFSLHCARTTPIWLRIWPAHSPPFSSPVASNHSLQADASGLRESNQTRRTQLGFFL